MRDSQSSLTPAFGDSKSSRGLQCLLCKQRILQPIYPYISYPTTQCQRPLNFRFCVLNQAMNFLFRFLIEKKKKKKIRLLVCYISWPKSCGKFTVTEYKDISISSWVLHKGVGENFLYKVSAVFCGHWKGWCFAIILPRFADFVWKYTSRIVHCYQSRRRRRRIIL